MDTIVNKVAESGILTLDLSKLLPEENLVAEFDIKPFLFREMILKEKDYRAALLANDWEPYREKNVAIFCSADAIIPVWAYMLVVTYLQSVGATAYFGTKQELKKQLLLQAIGNIDKTEYADKRVVIKGCGDIHVPDEAYVAATQVLLPVVKSVMYGEPCSTVPVYKKKPQV